MTMTVDELQESDVIFSDEYDSSSNRAQIDMKVSGKKQRIKKCMNKSVSHSVPICIPNNKSVSSLTDFDEDDQMLPPHLIVARRIEERMAFSVQAGYGRPALKGRELSQVRYSILRMTGFLEA